MKCGCDERMALHAAAGLGMLHMLSRLQGSACPTFSPAVCCWLLILRPLSILKAHVPARLVACSLEAECGGLQAELARERAVAAERLGDHQEALQQLDSMRWAWRGGASVCGREAGRAGGRG